MCILTWFLIRERTIVWYEQIRQLYKWDLSGLGAYEHDLQ
jgi:hypothetical protein